MSPFQCGTGSKHGNFCRRLICVAGAVTLVIFIYALYVNRTATITSQPTLVNCPHRFALDSGEIRTSTAGTALQEAFENIYSNKRWGYEGGGSGVGSSLHATATVRIILELVVQRYGITYLTDAPCGAMHWIPVALLRISAHTPCFRYLGVDVARPVLTGALDLTEMHAKILCTYHVPVQPLRQRTEVCCPLAAWAFSWQTSLRRPCQPRPDRMSSSCVVMRCSTSISWWVETCM
jgi:hypothetical protein